MNGNTMKLLSEYIAELHRKEKERDAKTYSTIYESAVTDTNGVEQDWDNEDKE